MSDEIKDIREPGLYIKSKEEIIKWLEANGYRKNRIGNYDGRFISFVVDMFDYCGKKIIDDGMKLIGLKCYYMFFDYYWLPEWIEKVSEKLVENIENTESSYWEDIAWIRQKEIVRLQSAVLKLQEQLKKKEVETHGIITYEEWKVIKERMILTCKTNETCNNCAIRGECLNYFENKPMI
jgi:hypothetical protein